MLISNWNEYLQLLAGLVSVVNPIGAIPTFMALTATRSLKDKKRTALVCASSVFMVLQISLLAGEPILNFFSIGLPAFRVAGGILILLMGLRMLHATPDPSRHTPEEHAESSEKESVAVVPLAIPLLSGPGAISTTIVYGHMENSWLHYLLMSTVILSVSLIVWVALLVAPKIAGFMGQTGINVVTRVMGLMLAAIAVEFIAKGLSALFPVLASIVA
jgi:multiple antibiotic resistance protein